MAVHTKLLRKDIKRILAFYDIGELISYSGINEGIENTNYKIKTTYDNFILTIFEKRVNKQSLPFFLKLMSKCHNNKFQCPQPVIDKKGKDLNEHNSKSFAFFSFLSGKSKKIWTENECFEVGKILGYFHSTNSKFDLKIENEFSIEFWKNTFNKIKKKINKAPPEVLEVLEKEIIFLSQKWPNFLPKGIIHADLFPDNIFFLDSKISGILDFYFSCYDQLIYDVAITCNAWCFKNGKFQKSFFKNLIAGYENFRIINLKEKKNMNIIMRGAAIRFLITRLHDQIYAKGNSSFKKKKSHGIF